MCSVAIEKEMELDIYAGKLFFFFGHSLYWSPKKSVVSIKIYLVLF